jgi:hypothetical protein
MLLIYSDEKAGIGPSSPEWGKLMEEYGTFSAEVRASGAYETGDPLVDTPDAKTVRVRNGKAMVTAGPFAETAEQLGGFYLLNVKDMDEAVALAAKVPTAKYGSIEVRPILDMG